jgi:hypothetical protein
MTKFRHISFIVLFASSLFSIAARGNTGFVLSFDFYGHNVPLPVNCEALPRYREAISEKNIRAFHKELDCPGLQQAVTVLQGVKNTLRLNDWLYYQLIRKAAQQLSPKAENYTEYTLYKWYLLGRSGYDALLRVNADKILFYVRSADNIYNIPGYLHNNRQFICLNYHDYGNHIDFAAHQFTNIFLPAPAEITSDFSYRVTRLPDFHPADYVEKELRFTYQENEYQFKIKLNNQVKTIFANYPAVDYDAIFNIPLSRETYNSLIPLLRKQVNGMNVRNGVDYLMHFTRYAFMYEPDARLFGNEKRFSPEQTLLFDKSDCEDRVALFFCLVKEIYNLPMIVLSYPEHVTLAIKFDKPIGKPILYQGEQYSVCEPTPQREWLPLGATLASLAQTPYEVVYVYTPVPVK